MSSLRLTSPWYPPTEPHMYIPLTFLFTAVSPPNTYGPGHSPVASSCGCHNVTMSPPSPPTLTRAIREGLEGWYPLSVCSSFCRVTTTLRWWGSSQRTPEDTSWSYSTNSSPLGWGELQRPPSSGDTTLWSTALVLQARPTGNRAPREERGRGRYPQARHTHTSHTAGLTRTEAVV